MKKQKYDPSNDYLTPENKDEFANWLLSLKHDPFGNGEQPLVKEHFNGFMYEKVFKSVRDLYLEWWNKKYRKL